MKVPASILLAIALCLVTAQVRAESPVNKLLDQSRQYYQLGDYSNSVLKMQDAEDLIWQQASIWVGQAVLVSQKAAGYGVYEPRQNNVYSRDDPILIYIEPMGYRHRKMEGGFYQFGFSIDLLLKLPSGKVLTGQTDIQKVLLKSRKPNKETYLNVAYSISGAPPGKYIIETVLHDLMTGETTSLENEIIFR